MIFYLTRTNLNLLMLHTEKPYQSQNTSEWFSNGMCVVLPKNSFPEVTVENSPKTYKLVEIK